MNHQQDSYRNDKCDIPGTFIFDGAMAMKGYALNKMCYSFNEAANRDRFRKNPEIYCRLQEPLQ